MAITSEAAVISKPVSRGTPCLCPPSPTMVLRMARSFMSMTRRQSTRRGSIRSWFPKYMWLSSNAASRLWAEEIAWKSPVKCRLMRSRGMTWLRPPPVAPPFMPNDGPSDGSRNARQADSPIRASPWASPMLVVVLPSPAFVGVFADTSTRCAGFSRCRTRRRTSGFTLAISVPYDRRSAAGKPSWSAMSMIGRGVTDSAISLSVGMRGIIRRKGKALSRNDHGMATE